MYKKVRILLELFLAAVLSLVFAHGISAAERESITIIGFVNRVAITEENGSILDCFHIAEDELMDGLFAGNKLDVYDKTPELEQMRVNEIILAMEMGINDPIYQQFESDYIVYGYLTNMSIKRATLGLTNFSAGFDGKSDTVCVNLSAKVVESKTGNVVFVATSKGESTRVKTHAEYGGHNLRFGKNSVPEQAASNAVAKAAREIAKKINQAV